jgi:hypothetical protein
MTQNNSADRPFIVAREVEGLGIDYAIFSDLAGSDQIMKTRPVVFVLLVRERATI